MKFPFRRLCLSVMVVRSAVSPRRDERRIAAMMVIGTLGWGSVMAEPLMHVVMADPAGPAIIREGAPNVLQYNYQTVQAPPGVMAKIAPGNQKYARPRGDYIHPLYGLSGEELTLDWAVDHPHHRGIYWAWPEVMLGDQTGDLHALQRVFARPAGTIRTQDGESLATVEAENDWMWEDKTPIVREKVVIQAEKAGPNGRRIDLSITLVALVDGVTIARRETDKYGGLNSRFGPAKGLAITHHADAEGAVPRMAWHHMTGTWGESNKPTGITILEKSGNPGYPADHIEFPELAWFQPTFPKAGERHALKKGEPLVLQYRYIIRGGDTPDENMQRDEWRHFNQPASINNQPVKP